MGLRNATIRSLAVPDMTTTVLTLTLTGLASDSRLAGGSNPRIARRATAVILMFAGACTGALLLRWGATATLVLAGLVSGSAAALMLKPQIFSSIRSRPASAAIE
jgi:hypothetical protein